MPMEYEDYLEHYGVKGMKWGQRRAQNRELNRASRTADREKKKVETAAFNKERNKAVLKARGRADKNKLDVAKAKLEYKSNKATMGSREAKKILNKVKEKRYDDKQLAKVSISGREMATRMALDYVIGGASYSIINAAQNNDAYRVHKAKYGN